MANGTIIINLGDVAAEQAGRGCSANFFSLVDTPETRSAVDGQYLQTLGLHLLAVVGPDTLSTRDAVARLQRTYRGKLVLSVTRPGRMSFAAALKTIQESHPDAVYLLHTGGMAVEFLTQFATAGLKTQTVLMAPYTTLDQTTLAASAPAALEGISVGPWVDDLENPSNHRLSTEFELEYGRPPSVQTAFGYDAALLLDAAVRAMDKKTLDVDALRAALRRAEFASTRGSVKFDTNQFPIQSYFVRQVVADSRGRLVNGQKALFARDVRDGHAADCPLHWVAEASAPTKKK
jgi:branched-chain amino acid transport system substrate-binding protein